MADTDDFGAAQVAELLVAAGHHHHQAYADSDGIDPEWALWYASFLQAQIWDRVGVIPTRSRLVQLLLNAEEQFEAAGIDGPWPPFYAEIITAALSG